MMNLCEMGSFGEFFMGGKFSKKDFVDEGINVVSSLAILSDKNVVLNSVPEKMSRVKSENMVEVQYGDIVILTKSYTKAKLGRGSAWLGTHAVTGNEIAIFRHNESARYLAYYTRSSPYIKDILSSATLGIVNSISIERLKRIKIPIPDRCVQEEIADSLDAMLGCCQFLTTEHLLHREQECYYNNYLLTF